VRARVRPAEAGQAHRRGYHNEYYDKTRMRRRELARASKRARTTRRYLLHLLASLNLEFLDHGDPTDT
jgi:hypothetical protein